MRLFIAIELPEEAKEELRKAQQQLPNGKLSLAKELHITLKFLGEVTPDRADEVREKLQKVKFEAFKAKLDSAGFFPSEKYIRVIWAGIKPEEETIKLQKEIDSAICKEFPYDYKFSPHITLARVKFVDDKKEFIQQLKKIKLEKINFKVDFFKLKKSILRGNEGPAYEDLQVYNSSLTKSL